MRTLNLLILFSTVWLFSCDDSTPVDVPPVIRLQSQTMTDGSLTMDVWGYETGGREYAIIGDFTNLEFGNVTFVDVTDPVNPIIVSVVDNIIGFDMKVWGNYVYVANGGGFNSVNDPLSRIIDISDINSPVVVSSFEAAHNIWVDDQGFLYITGGSPNVKIYNLNIDPLNPSLVWEDQTGTEGHDLAVIRNKLYDFHGNSGTYIYDVTTPQSPVQLSFVPYSLFSHSGWVTEDDNYVFIADEGRLGDGPGIVIYDIRDLNQPIQISSITLSGSRSHNLYIIDNYAYISHYGAGFVVYDVSDPSDPHLLNMFDTNLNDGVGVGSGFEGAFGVYPFASSGRIYLSDINNDLFVFTFE